MITELKKDLYQMISSLGYNITDNGMYVENFPWLMLRTGDNRVLNTSTFEVATASFVLDIFSTYTGEKEILDIIENITSHLQEVCDNNPDILFGYQKNLKILDDKATGPVRKHGVVVYEFLTGFGKEESEAQ